MAVAVKQAPEAGPRGAFNSLPVASLVGVVYVLISLAVLYLLPDIWQASVGKWLVPAAGEFVNGALLGLAVLAAVVGLVYLGTRLAGPQPPAGLRAGIFVGLLGALVVGLIARWAGLWLEHWTFVGHLFGSEGRTVGAVITAVIGLALLVLLARSFLKPGFQQWLVKVEEQGWFSTTAYKRSQGQRIRRWTIVGILALVAAGIFTMDRRGSLAGTGDLAVPVPFTASVPVDQPNDAAGLLKERFGSAEGLVVDRYALRDVNDELLRNYVRVVEPGLEDDELEPGQLVARGDFEKRVADRKERIRQLEDEAKKLEEAGNALGARDKRDEAARLRRGTPEAGEPVPATGKDSYARLTLLPAVQLTLPLLLGAAALWLAWRMVNLPVFADFLIATEAEMNKVSWSSKRRLFQDTIVVLVAVVLMTFFLLFADLLWSNLLRGIGVLRFGDSSSQKQDTKSKERGW